MSELKKHVRLMMCKDTDPFIGWLWEALEELSA